MISYSPATSIVEEGARFTIGALPEFAAAKPDTARMMNILHLEDSDDDAALICASLSQGGICCRVTRVETRTALIDALDRGGWDIILADYSLPGFNGVAALKLAIEKLPDTPFILVTGSLGEELAIEVLKGGATDYVLKHRLDRLPQAVMRARRESESAAARKAAERELKDSLREKVLLLQEVHHRVNNNLQIICSLLNMQSERVSDPLLSSALQESQKRVQSMAMIHAMLYASSSLKDIDFAEYTQDLAAKLFSSYAVDPARIRLALELAPLRFEIDRAIPCGMILNELLCNALKYAFPDGRSGQICVTLQAQDGCNRLTVADDGVGLPEGHPTRTRSLGLNIVRILTRQLGGSMVTTSDHGTQFVLEFAQ